MAGANRRRLARLEAATGIAGGGGERLRGEVETLTAACEQEVDDRRFCDAYLRLLAAEHRLHLAAPASEPAPPKPIAEMTDEEIEEHLNAQAERDPRRAGLHARFREVASSHDVERYLGLFQTGGACA